MNRLHYHGQAINTVFSLLGRDENAMTASLGWTLANAPAFRAALAEKLGIAEGFSDNFRLALQEHRQSKGFTDLELIDPGKHHIILEAKRGFAVPRVAQLEKYADRLIHNGDTQAQRLLLVLAESDREEQWLPLHTPRSVKGIPVKTISWQQFRALATQSCCSGGHAEKRLMRDFCHYLDEVTSMQNQNSSLVYVVVLNNKDSGIENIKNIEFVEQYRKYFHPVGGGKGGWPAEPPNYIAFRYYNGLQSIHHIEDYRVINSLSEVFSDKNGEALNEPHYLYNLGPAIKPDSWKPTNNKDNGRTIYPTGRRWCFIDLLLTCDSIADACFETKKRFGNSLTIQDESIQRAENDEDLSEAA